MPRIYDSVYGYIYLEENEFELVTSPIFQRLQWIKQLGPLHIIFPSAQHSRFSHSLGVFHIVIKLIEHLTKSGKVGLARRLQEKEIKELRFAALLHDIGHLPLSHTGEVVLEKTYTAEQDTKSIDAYKGKFDWKNLFNGYQGESSKLHECLSAQIVLHDKKIDEILTKTYDNNPAECKEAKENIAKIIVGIPDNPILSVLLHSELDADRLDFLLRDSAFTGVGYGHVELDYIISRLSVVTDKEGEVHLCVEDKGLHSVEHYLLSRFFLTTQVVYNRKVRLLDLLFADVMEYMITSEDGDRSILNLEEFFECIKGSQEDDEEKERERLHKIYKFTDAQVFMEMRKLHEELDPIVRPWRKESRRLNPDEEKKAYINDCIRMIMDGKVPEPLGKTHQRLIKVETNSEDYITKMGQEAEKIAKKIAKELGISALRIKANLKAEKVMKYTKLMDEREGPNREAVRIFYGEDKKRKVIFAAESNASILGGLIDKQLLIFNLYYIGYRDNKDKEREQSIGKAFEEYVKGYFEASDMG